MKTVGKINRRNDSVGESFKQTHRKCLLPIIVSCHRKNFATKPAQVMCENCLSVPIDFQCFVCILFFLFFFRLCCCHCELLFCDSMCVFNSIYHHLSCINLLLRYIPSIETFIVCRRESTSHASDKLPKCLGKTPKSKRNWSIFEKVHYGRWQFRDGIRHHFMAFQWLMVR